MTRHQRIALASPCFEPEETGASRFGWRAAPNVSLRLTANIGLE